MVAPFFPPPLSSLLSQAPPIRSLLARATDGPLRRAGLPPADVAAAAVDGTLRGLRRAGALAILRVKGADSIDAAVARGVELADMGCDAIEVTLDSPGWKDILIGLRASLPPRVLLGVGTVMDETVSHVGTAASLGATFALSPIDPVGFIDECHRHGVLAVPSGFTSNEWYDLHRRGAKMVKLFHAGLVPPATLKSMLGVTPLGEQMCIMPSGGVSPKNAPDWWDAGACVLGMGSNLVGMTSTRRRGRPCMRRRGQVAGRRQARCEASKGQGRGGQDALSAGGGTPGHFRNEPVSCHVTVS